MALFIVPDLHDQYAGRGGIFVINAAGERVPAELAQDPEPPAPAPAVKASTKPSNREASTDADS